MSDYVIQCDHCRARFRINPRILAPQGRHLRCANCRSIFFMALPAPAGVRKPPPPPPPKPVSEDETVHLSAYDSLDGMARPPERRRNDRLFLQARAELRLEKGLLYRGTTEDLTTAGVAFLPDTHSREVMTGDKGIFSFILEDGTKEYFTEFTCQVAYIEGPRVGVVFIEKEKKTETLRNENFELVQPGARVFVRRRNGALEGGWEVLPANSPLPGNIKKSLEDKEKVGSSCVCVKWEGGEGGENQYKVYQKLDLVAIQLAAQKAGYKNP